MLNLIHLHTCCCTHQNTIQVYDETQGEEMMEEGGSPAIMTWKWAPIEGKEIWKMLQQI
jgi:hypothetical protein